MTMLRAAVIAVATSAICSLSAIAQTDDIRTERVQFAAGAISAIVEDSITGYEIVDYLLGARAGQSMNVSMATDNGANYFNVMAPGETDVAFFIGSTSGNQYEGVLAADGDYTIRVYMMRNAARRDEVANYRLEMVIAAGGGQSSAGDDALVPGTEYNATGMVPCRQARDQPMGQCDFGVIREGSGSGTVVITKPDGSTRAVFFQDGEAVGSDASQADGGAFKAKREGDLSIVHVGHERYEIPDAVIYGG